MVSRRDRKEDAEIAELDYRQHPLRPLRENIMLSIKGLALVSRRDRKEYAEHARMDSRQHI